MIGSYNYSKKNPRKMESKGTDDLVQYDSMTV